MVNEELKEKPLPFYEESSDNIFADLGLPDPEERLAKAKVLLCLIQLIRSKKMTQKRISAIMGIPQPKVSGILTGDIDGYSLERLLRFVVLLGQDVEIVISKPKTEKPQMSVTVHEDLPLAHSA